MFQDDPTEEKPDLDSLELQLTSSNGSDQFSNDPDEDSQLRQPKRIKMEEDEEDVRTSVDSANGHHHQGSSHKNGDGEGVQENSGMVTRFIKCPDPEAVVFRQRRLSSRVVLWTCLYNSFLSLLDTDEFNPKIVSVETTEGTPGSPSSSHTGIRINQLEKEVNSLECLLVTKELEWNAILRIKKLKELLLDQMRREEDIGSILFPSDGTDVKSLVKECLLDQDNIGKIVSEAKSFTGNIRTEIAKVELEITENSGRRYRKIVHDKEDPLQFDTRIASKALQQLSERNSAAVKSKQGRNGPIVPVTSLIADYR